MRPIGQHPFARWSRKNAALGARLPGTLALIVGVEAVVEGLVERPIAGQVLGENERLEKPGYVCEVPFRRASIFHRLDCHVLGAERLDELMREVPRIQQAVFEIPVPLDRCALN